MAQVESKLLQIIWSEVVIIKEQMVMRWLSGTLNEIKMIILGLFQ
jgi:hypothetical protein